MCSVLGIHRVNRNIISSDDIDLVKSSLKTHLSQRGPDSTYFHLIGDSVVVAGTRLAITCEKDKGVMPFVSDGITCVYNGQIYNYRELSGCVSDGEVLIPLYKEHGIDFIRMLDGEFSIALNDESTGVTYLIRDAFGTKPLYFSIRKNEVIWGSTERSIAAIRPHRFCATLKDLVYKHTFTTAEPYTNYEGIWKIPPGHYLKIDCDSVSLIRYNYWNPVKDVSINQLYDTILESFSMRLTSIHQLAIPLSAGIDSGIIVSIADRLNVDYSIFSVDRMFSQNTAESEGIYRRIDELKSYRNVELIDVSEAAYLKALEKIYEIGYYDSFRLDSGMIPAYVLYSKISECGLKVAIDGAGGDELFHGYEFREDFQYLSGWPREFEQCPYYYSMYSTLLSYTEKSDRAAGYFSIENRVPFQSKALANIAMGYLPRTRLKWPLRDVFSKKIMYGKPSDLDLNRKYGFSLKNTDKTEMHRELKEKWLSVNRITNNDLVAPEKFPFVIGGVSIVDMRC